jgi:hypothetical protein
LHGSPAASVASRTVPLPRHSFPGGAVHVEHAAAPAAENVDGGQGVGLTAAGGQNEPAGHGGPGELAPEVAQKVPAAHGFAVDALLPGDVQ